MNDKDEKTFLLAEALGEADEGFIAEAEKEYSPGRKRAQIVLIIILCAALILGGVSSLAARARRAKWRTEPAVTFSDLSPQFMTLTKVESFEDAEGAGHWISWRAEITDREAQRRILALLDEAKLISVQSQLDYYAVHERSREVSDSVHLHIEEDNLIYEIGFGYAEITREDEPKLDVVIFYQQKGSEVWEHAMWVYKAEKEACLRLFDELWEYTGGERIDGPRGDILSDGYGDPARREGWTRPEGRPIAPDHPLKETDRGGIWDEFREAGK